MVAGLDDVLSQLIGSLESSPAGIDIDPAGDSLERTTVRLFRLLLPLALVSGGCQEQPQPSTRADTARGVVVDSALPIGTLLQRFQAGLPEPRILSPSASSREELTRRYLDAVARSDTVALGELHISRAEYAFLYFPASAMMRPPYELPPDVAWLLLTAESGKGISSILRRFGGERLELRAVRCPGDPLREGANIVWRDCVVRYRGEGPGEHERPLFAAIIERDGRFKFFSYATPL